MEYSACRLMSTACHRPACAFGKGCGITVSGDRVWKLSLGPLPFVAAVVSVVPPMMVLTWDILGRCRDSSGAKDRGLRMFCMKRECERERESFLSMGCQYARVCYDQYIALGGACLEGLGSGSQLSYKARNIRPSC